MEQRTLSCQDMSSMSASNRVPPASAALHMDLQNKSYLPLMISALNHNLDTLGRRPNEKFQVKDFDAPLTPDLFRKILAFLITQVVPDTGLEGHAGRLMGLRKLNESHAFHNKVGYDPIINTLYWTCRRIFDEFHQELLDFQLLFYPQREPKRVKYVLNFITAFAFFCDQATEKFEEVDTELDQEFLEGEKARNRLEEVKTKLNARIVNLEEWKNEMPHLREKLKTNIELIRTVQTRILKLEAEIRKHKETYEAAQQKNLNVERELDLIHLQIRRKRDLVVSDGDTLLKAHEHEFALLTACSREREELDAQHQKFVQTEAELGTLIDGASLYATELEEFVTYLQTMVELAEKKHSSLAELDLCERKAKDHETEINRLKSQLEGLNKRQRHNLASKRAKIERVREEIQARKKKLEEQRKVLQSKEEAVGKADQECQKVVRQIKAKRQEIVEGMRFVEHEGPDNFAKLERTLSEALEAFDQITGAALVQKLPR